MRTSIPARAILTVTVAFLVLAGLLVWMHGSEGEQSQPEVETAVGPAQTEGESRHSALSAEPPMSSEDIKRARRAEVQRLVHKLRTGNVPERRRAALRLHLRADETAERALLETLGDPQEDLIVLARCEKALIDLWRRPCSLSARAVFAQALADCDAGDYDEALQGFNMCEEDLRAAIPELYRLRAQIHLEQGRIDEAIEDCARALRLKPDNFMAYYVSARCYVGKRKGREALEEVELALQIYPAFELAAELKAQIESLQKAGEL